jgi:hypothetical protein
LDAGGERRRRGAGDNAQRESADKRCAYGAEPFQMYETIRLYIGWSRKLMSSAYQQGGFRHGHSCDRDALSA